MTPDAFTDQWYAQLAEATQAQDAARGNVLYRWMQLLGHQLAQVTAIIDRIDYLPADEGGDGGTSDLADPRTADVAWLPWLGQLLGVQMPAASSPDAARDAVAYASSGWQAGTEAGMSNAARSALTGTQYVRLVKNWNGSHWTVCIRTRASETASSQAVLAAVVSKHAKPAGVLLVHQAYSPTRTYADTTLPTRAQWDAAMNPRATFEELGAPTS